MKPEGGFSSWGPTLVGFAFVAALYVGRGLLPGVVAIPLDLLHDFGAWKNDPDARVTVSNPLLHDVVTQFLPWNLEARRLLLDGEVPWIDPYVADGAPLFANPQTALLSPLNWLPLVWPLEGWELLYLLRLVLGALGSFALARELGARPWAARFSAFVFVASGHSILWLAHPNATVTALLPFLATSMLRLCRCVSPARVLAVVVLAALATAAGHPESLLTGALGIGALLCWQGRRGEAPHLGWSMGAAGTGFLLLSVVTVPFLYLLAVSEATELRAMGGVGEFRWIALLSQFLPGILGSPLAGELDLGRLAGPQETLLMRGGGYVGAIVLVLLVLERPQLRPLQRRALAIGAVALVLAWRPPLIEHIFYRLPLLGVTLVSYRLVPFVLFGAAVAGTALLRVRRHPRAGLLLAIAGLVLLIGGLLVAVPRVAEGLAREGLRLLEARHLLPNPMEVYEGRLPAYLDALTATAVRRYALPGLCWLTAGLALALECRHRVRWIAAAAAVELLAFGLGWIPSLSRSAIPRPPEIIRQIAALDPEREFELIAGQGVFPPNLGTLYRVRDARSYYVLEDEARMETLRALGYRAEELAFPAALTPRQQRGLAATGVRFFLSREPVAGAIRVGGDSPPAVGLYELPQAQALPLPRNAPPAGIALGLGLATGAAAAAGCLLVAARRVRARSKEADG